MQDKDSAPRLLIDLNYILNKTMLGGKDPDAIITLVDGKPVSVNSARYGVDGFFEQFTKLLDQLGTAPRNVIGVWDGRNAKAYRQTILPGYKASTRTDGEYEQIDAARGMVSQMLHDMGAHTVQCDGCEGDDVIAYLARFMRDRRNIVVSGDGDLSVLVDSNTDFFNVSPSRYGELNVNPFGQIPHKFITLYKALVGDPSDKIPGANGFGDAAFVKLVSAFGLDGLEMMEKIILGRRIKTLAEDVGELKALQKIIDNEETVYLSWRAAQIHYDRVNTLKRPLQWRAGMVKQWADLQPEARVDGLKAYYGTCTLVHAGNYERALASLKPQLAESPVVAFDIETSVGEESLSWMEQTRSRGSKGVSVDVQGSKLTGFSLAFGQNLQHAVYVTVDHREEDDVKNITSDQARAIMEAVPQDTHIVAWNRSFELQVMWHEWGEAWKDNGWFGFIPNCIDGLIEASYVDENLSLGLKFRSKEFLGVEQDTYEDTTTMSGAAGALPKGGHRKKAYLKEVEPGVEQEWEDRQYQMNELTARHVFSYGIGDSAVTAALHTWQRAVMEMEGSWGTFLRVELLPEYTTSLATIRGVPIALGKLSRMEAADRAALAKAEETLHSYLTESGWAGTTLPQHAELTPANVKEAVHLILGPAGKDADGADLEFSTRKRKLDAIAEDIRQTYPDSETADLLAGAVAQNDVSIVNGLLERHFTGRPDFNTGSVKQVRKFLYELIGMKMRLLVKPTEKQRADNDFKKALYAHRDWLKGELQREPTDYEREVWISKAATDDDAIELALHLDNLPEREREVLQAFLDAKEVQTRLSLFFASWSTQPHWSDGRLHPAFNQCRAVTRRHSSDSPNLQQAPAKGQGAKLREALTAPDDWIHVSCDLSGQELRGAARLSQDEAMIACFVGDSPIDLHSAVAVQAAPVMWGKAVTYGEFMAMRKSEDPEEADRAKALRDAAKVVNFAGIYGASAMRIAIAIKGTEEDAQLLLDAKDRVFPGIQAWKEKVEAEAEESGIAVGPNCAPRHLRESVLSPYPWVRSKAVRQSSNFPIQAGGGAELRIALARMWETDIFTGKYRASPVGPIHDEFCAMVHKDDAVAFIREMHTCMLTCYADDSVPSKSAIAIGRDFSTPVDLGDSATDEEIAEAVAALFAEAT